MKYIFGCGGMGRQFAAMMLEPVVFVSEMKEPEIINGIDVWSAERFFDTVFDERPRFNVAIQDSLVRQRIAEDCCNRGLSSFNFVHPLQWIPNWTSFGMGAIICDGVSINPNVRIGKFFQCNSQCYIGHDCVIGDYVTFAPQAFVAGNVSIDDHAFIGAGAKIRENIRIGAHAIIGMGAVVLRNVDNHEIVAGNPARHIRMKAIAA